MKVFKFKSSNKFYFYKLNAVCIMNSDDKRPFAKIIFYKNGKFHNKNNASIIYHGIYYISRSWYYKGFYYGYDNDFTNSSWKKKVKQIKQELKMSIFK